jgi:hypothetical protein
MSMASTCLGSLCLAIVNSINPIMFLECPSRGDGMHIHRTSYVEFF